MNEQHTYIVHTTARPNKVIEIDFRFHFESFQQQKHKQQNCLKQTALYLVIVFPNYDCILSQLKYTVNGLTANTMAEHAIRIRPTKQKKIFEAKV